MDIIMNGTPLFSVLIANYNNGKYLMEAIESVRQQTYTNWEIILVDDGSTDNSPSLYNELQNDERIHIFYNNENKGCGFTKHQCVLHANGELCGFLDPDDVLLPNALKVSAQALLSQPTASLSFSRFYYCDEMLNIIDESRVLQLLPGETYFEHKDYSPEHFSSFRKSAYNKTAGIDVTLFAAVDQDLYFKLEEVGSIICLSDILYKYRQHTSGISQNENEDWAFYWNTIVRHNVCVRRKLQCKSYSYDNFKVYIQNHLDDAIKKTEAKIRDTKSYKLGHYLLYPFKRMLHL